MVVNTRSSRRHLANGSQTTSSSPRPTTAKVTQKKSKWTSTPLLKKKSWSRRTPTTADSTCTSLEETVGIDSKMITIGTTVVSNTPIQESVDIIESSSSHHPTTANGTDAELAIGEATLRLMENCRDLMAQPVDGNRKRLLRTMVLMQMLALCDMNMHTLEVDLLKWSSFGSTTTMMTMQAMMLVKLYLDE